MTQVLIDLATLEQLVESLEFINYLDCDINFLTTNAQEEIVDSALTAGRAAIANAKRVELDASTIGELEHAINIVKQKSAVAV